MKAITRFGRRLKWPVITAIPAILAALYILAFESFGESSTKVAAQIIFLVVMMNIIIMLPRRR